MSLPGGSISSNGRALPPAAGGVLWPLVWIDDRQYVSNDRNRGAELEWLLPEGGGPSRRHRGHAPDGPRRQADGTLRGVSTRLELILYVSAYSPASIRAELAMKEVLKSFAADDISYSVCDLAEYPREAERDRVIFTPTLVKRFPGPRAWVLGNLENPSIVVELLMAAGVTRLP
jgi:hypothetical protein